MSEAKPSAWTAPALSEGSAAWRVKKMFAPQTMLVLLPDGSAKMYVEELTVADLLNEFPGHDVGSATTHRSFLAHNKVLHLGSTYYLSRQESPLNSPSTQSAVSQQEDAVMSPQGLDSPSGVCALRLPDTMEELKEKHARRLAAIDSSLSPAQWLALNGLESRKLHSNSSVCSSASSTSDVFSVLSPRTPRGPLDAESSSGTSSPHSPALSSPQSHEHTVTTSPPVRSWLSDKITAGRNMAPSAVNRTLSDLAADVVSGQQVVARFPDMADDTWDSHDAGHYDSISKETPRHRRNKSCESKQLEANAVLHAWGARKQEEDIPKKAWDVFREGARKQQQSQTGEVQGSKATPVPRFGRVMSLPRSVDIMGSVAAAFDRAQQYQQHQQLNSNLRSRSSRFDVSPSAGLRSEEGMDAVLPVACLPSPQMNLLGNLAMSIRPANLVPCGLRRTTSSTASEEVSRGARTARPRTATGSGRGRRNSSSQQGLPPRPSSPVVPSSHNLPHSLADRDAARSQSPSNGWRRGSGTSSGGVEAEAWRCVSASVSANLSGNSYSSSDRISEHFHWGISTDRSRCKNTSFAAGPAPVALGAPLLHLSSHSHSHSGITAGRHIVAGAPASGSKSGPCPIMDSNASIQSSHSHAHATIHSTASLPALNVAMAKTGDSPSRPLSSSPSPSSSSPTAPLSPNTLTVTAVSSPSRVRVHRPSRFKGE